jgi:hypothetical protein
MKNEFAVSLADDPVEAEQELNLLLALLPTILLAKQSKKLEMQAVAEKWGAAIHEILEEDL